MSRSGRLVLAMTNEGCEEAVSQEWIDDDGVDDGIGYCLDRLRTAHALLASLPESQFDPKLMALTDAIVDAQLGAALAWTSHDTASDDVGVVAVSLPLDKAVDAAGVRLNNTVVAVNTIGSKATPFVDSSMIDTIAQWLHGTTLGISEVNLSIKHHGDRAVLSFNADGEGSAMVVPIRRYEMPQERDVVDLAE